MKFNLALIFQIQGLFNLINGILFWFMPATMLQMTNLMPTPDLSTMAQAFGTMFIAVGIIGWYIPGWAGINIARAGKNFAFINLIWSSALAYHLITGATSGIIPLVSIFINLVFAILYYLKSR